MTADAAAPRPICFMVMPFGTKPTGLDAGRGPLTVDFDALWNKVYRPLIEEDLGFVAVRGDEEISPLILNAMIESLALSDLVIGEISILNANVYYEIGVRHGAQAAGCVLVAASWAVPAFDLGPTRRVPFPLPDGAIPDADVPAMRAALKAGVMHQMRQKSVLYELLPGFPGRIDEARTERFRERVASLQAVERGLNTIRNAERGKRKALAAAKAAELAAVAAQSISVALAIIYLLRDLEAWEELRAFIDDALPRSHRDSPVVREQHALARSKLGDHLDAIDAIEGLIASEGDTSERRGLLGGRYKKLWAAATDPRDKQRYLNQAIDAYTAGMWLDLNDYYPSSNLPRLLRARGNPGDEAEARTAAAAASLACRRSMRRDPNDRWARPTLLGAAFDAGNVDEARRLADEIGQLDAKAAAETFHLTTTLVDIRQAILLHGDPALRAALTAVADEIARLAT